MTHYDEELIEPSIEDILDDFRVMPETVYNVYLLDRLVMLVKKKQADSLREAGLTLEDVLVKY